MPPPYPQVDGLRQISFPDALVALQAMLGQNVTVEFNDHDSFAGCGFSGTLERVRTLPPDESAVMLVLGDGSLFLDPKEVTAHASDGRAPGISRLEFWVASGPSIVIEVTRDEQPNA